MASNFSLMATVGQDTTAHGSDTRAEESRLAQQRRRSPRKPAAALAAASTLDPNWLANATSEDLAETFRSASTLPLDAFLNEGGHAVDVAARTIYNDENWKGWLPRGLALRDIFTRLATGYAKRFWKQGQRYLGETIYLDGNILVKHALEEITIDRPINDLDPGKYVLLRYTDPVFEHLFYDVMRAADDGVIVYGGYTGRFPEGKRGFTSVLMRRYSFAQLGERDHQQLFRKGARPARESLKGDWQMDVVTTANHATRVGTLSLAGAAGGTLAARLETISHPAVLVPSFVVDHFNTADASKIERELRAVDGKTIVGTWTSEISPLYARFVSAFPGLFHREGEKGSRRYTMRYLLSRA
jgi:hypothetical protein